MDKLKLRSPDFTQANIAKLAELFPHCVTETSVAKGDGSGSSHELKRAIDFDLLRQELSASIVEGPQERYQLNWPGKREALLTANAPIAKTLRPCREESVDFDTTQNLFIEGDNLDALKLLQETYLGKIKMIYIDPPYNTGKEFIYDDDFSENTASYFQRSNQKDEAGNRMVANTEANGRFHSDWLSMMYPRLKLARNLLRDDGVIFISIDDNEQANLKRLCDEVFGEDNFAATLVWDRNRKNDAKYFSVGHEYMLVYFRNEAVLANHKIIFRGEKDGIEEVKEEFLRLKNENGSDWGAVRAGLLEFYAKIRSDDDRFPLTRFTKVDDKGPFRNDGNINWPGGNGPRYEVIHPITNKPCKIPTSGWRYPTPERFWEEVNNDRIVFGEDETTVPRVRTNLFENSAQVMGSVHYSYAQTATNQFTSIFDGMRVFDNPKPISDIRQLISYVTEKDDLICDFFSGSSTTAHAVMQLNAEDGGKRKFIMVQLPEACDEKSEAFKAGYQTIADIGKERIRRAGKKILNALGVENLEGNSVGEALASTGPSLRVEAKASPTQTSPKNTPPAEALLTTAPLPDIGFRVLKIDSSNMKDVYYTPDAVQQHHLFDQIDTIREDRSAEDLLFQVLLDWGMDLTLPITQETLAGKTVLFVDGNRLAACFDADINEPFVKELATRHPLKVVFRDAGFVSDSVKINIEQIFKLVLPNTEIKTL